MSYGQRLKMIAYEAGRQEEAIERLKFCFDVYLEFVRDGREPAPDMDAAGATQQLEAAIRNLLGYPPEV